MEPAGTMSEDQQLAFAYDLRRVYDAERARRRELEEANKALAAANAELDRRVYDLLAAQDWILAVNSSRELPSLIDLLSQPLVLLLHAQASVVFPWDRDVDALRGAFGHGVLAETPELATLRTSPLTAVVLARSQVCEITDLDQVPEPATSCRAARALGWRALAAQQLVARGERAGVLYVAWETPHQMDDRERTLLDVLAQHAALSLTNARSFDENQRQMNELERLRRQLAECQPARDV